MNAERKTLLLTGASRGIGHATVRRFSDAGWRVITSPREGVPPECKRDPNWTHHVTADLAETGAVEQFIAEVDGIIGERALHALVHNPGGSPKTPFSARSGCRHGAPS